MGLPIIGGIESPGMQPSVMLASYPADRSVLDTCSAVIVSPTVLLTAAHCVDAAHHPNYIFGVFTGDDASAYPMLVDLEPHLVAVSAVHAHPMYNNLVADIGVVILAQPTNITPAPIHRETFASSIVGATAKIVGYGQTTYQQPNQKRFEATTTITGLEAQTLVAGDAAKHTCIGDSGGGVFVNGELVGIDSYGPVGCTEASHFQRTDFFEPFIAMYAPKDMPAQPDAGVDDPKMSSDGGGCSTGGSTSAIALLALLPLARRRRR